MEVFRVFIEPDDGGGIVWFIILVLVLSISLSTCGEGDAPAESDTEPAETVQPWEAPADESGKTNITKLRLLADQSDVIDNAEKGSVMDAWGNTYSGGYYDLCSYTRPGGDVVQAYSDLACGGKYRYFSGTYFARDTQDDDFAIVFKVYADGKLVYESGEVTRSDKPVDFYIDIKNCDILTIVSYSDDYSAVSTNPGIIVASASVHN